MESDESYEPSTALEVIEPGRALDLAEQMFTEERREQIAQFLEVPADHPAFLPFLAVAAAYKLNPTMGEIWLIPQNVREKVNGRWETTGVRYRPTVGRDGLLSIARRDPSYIGIKHDVVRENDVFEVEHDTERFDAPPKIRHIYAPKEAGKSSKASRGRAIGAWAVMYLRNRPPVYYYADVTEHAQTTTVDGQKAYKGAWDHTSQMLIKAAMSYVLRLGLGVTGILPADEMQLPGLEAVKQGVLMPAEEEGDGLPPEEEFWNGIREEAGDEVVVALKEKFAESSLAEVEMTLSGLSEAELREKAGLAVGVPEAEVVDVEAPEEAVDVVALRERRMEVEAEIDSGALDDDALTDLQVELRQIDERLAEAVPETTA